MDQINISNYELAYEQVGKLQTYAKDIEENLNAVRNTFRNLDYPNWRGSSASKFATTTISDYNQYDSVIESLYVAAGTLQQMIQNYQNVDNTTINNISDFSGSSAANTANEARF